MTNTHFHLGDMPPIGWAVLIMIIAMGVGKLFLIEWLFNLGIFGLGAIIIMLIIAFIYDFLNSFS